MLGGHSAGRGNRGHASWCVPCSVLGPLDVVCSVVRAWLSGLGANAVTEDRAVGVLELECVWCRPVWFGRGGQGRHGADLSVVHANQGR